MTMRTKEQNRGVYKKTIKNEKEKRKEEKKRKDRIENVKDQF